jgi:Transposase DDE domain
MYVECGQAGNVAGHKRARTEVSTSIPTHCSIGLSGEERRSCLTPGNVDDLRPVPFLVKRLRGKLIGDRGYLSASLTQLLFEQGLHLITRLRKNMSNRLMHLCDKLQVAQTSHRPDHHRPTQEHFPD